MLALYMNGEGMMKILLQTRFHPAVGGIESLANVLSHQWTSLGHNVKITTDVAAKPSDIKDFPFDVHHRPSMTHIRKLGSWADIIVHMNISLKMLLPNLDKINKLVSVHQACYYSGKHALSKSRNLLEKFKLFLAANGRANISASSYIASEIGICSIIIPNPYDEHVFTNCRDDDGDRTLDFAYVGRLVSDKGVDLLIDAFARLPSTRKWTLTIIGDGPEKNRLMALCCKLNLSNRVRFLGVLSPAKISEQLVRHRALIVPSVWEEPFGIVAVEGAGCGCIVLGSDRGGLPDAIGPCGELFVSGDVDSLKEKMEFVGMVKREYYLTQERRERIFDHLSSHSSKRIAEQYLNVFRQSC